MLDPGSLPDYVAPGAAAEVMSVEELQDPDWMKQLQDELDALEVDTAGVSCSSSMDFAIVTPHHRALPLDVRA